MNGSASPLECRHYGLQRRHLVVVLHGGPGAPGYMAPLAEILADRFRVLEPWQRGAGGEPLTVASHVADLHATLQAHRGSRRCALVGHSWGAMLALAYAAEHARAVNALVLIGCGTFDQAARDQLQANRGARLDAVGGRPALEEAAALEDPDARLQALGAAMLSADSFELDASRLPAFGPCDAVAHQQTWEDMLKHQAEGFYPAALATITAPTLMLHGDWDPHPGDRIRASLQQVIPHLECLTLERCGHYPWLEKHAREPFVAALLSWLAGKFKRPP